MKKKRGLNIYLIHSHKRDFNKELYLPLLRSKVIANNTLVLNTTEKNKNVYFKNLINEADIIIADLTTPDMGFNMELKEAIISKKPLLSIVNKNAGYDQKYNKLLKNIVGYTNESELVYFVETFITQYATKINEGKVDPTLVIGVLNFDNLPKE